MSWKSTLSVFSASTSEQRSHCQSYLTLGGFLQVDPKLHCDHQHLKTARETHRRIEQDLTQSTEQLNSEKSRNSQLEQDVENFRIRQKHITDLKWYQMKRPWIVRLCLLRICYLDYLAAKTVFYCTWMYWLNFERWRGGALSKPLQLPVQTSLSLQMCLLRHNVIPFYALIFMHLNCCVLCSFAEVKNGKTY